MPALFRWRWSAIAGRRRCPERHYNLITPSSRHTTLGSIASPLSARAPIWQANRRWITGPPPGPAAIHRPWLISRISGFYPPFYEQDEALERARSGLKASPWPRCYL